MTQWPEAAAAWWSRVSRGQEPTKSWHRVWVSPEAKIELPADDAPHTMRAERWRYSGHLKSDTGEGFTFHYTVTMRNATKTRSAIQVAFTDQQTGRHYTAQRRTEDDPSKDIKDGFHFQFGNWVMTRAAGNERLFVDTPEFSFELSLQQGAEPMMHGGTGLIQLETAGSSYYYARPRMLARGTAGVPGKTVAVTGEVWFDHQWSNRETTLEGRDIFVLQLDDGTDLMLYLTLDIQGQPSMSTGTIAKNGRVDLLTRVDFEVASSGSWASKTTGISYPLGWQIRVPDQSVDLVLIPFAQATEGAAPGATRNAKWVGAVRVEGSHTGTGFVELGPRSAAFTAGSQGQ